MINSEFVFFFIFEGGHDSCQGDSGGPLQVKGTDGHYFLAGVIKTSSFMEKTFFFLNKTSVFNCHL